VKAAMPINAAANPRRKTFLIIEFGSTARD